MRLGSLAQWGEILRLFFVKDLAGGRGGHSVTFFWRPSGVDSGRHIIFFLCSVEHFALEASFCMLWY